MATHLVEAAAWHKAVRPICGCGHAASFNPHGLWWYFEQRRWSDYLPDIRQRFWCKVCRPAHGKVTPYRIELISESDADIRLPFPPEHVWRREVRRMR